ncbi:YrbL family protein [Marinicella sp. W31]|uniref:YrbL family protein n=1 Tax=Marinicella sp. W31 TaxID=3023713 RepID=UPI00375820C5
MFKKHPQQSVSLSDATLIERGGRRDCYRHPQNPDWCIKVSQSQFKKDKQAIREIKYYSLYKRLGIPHTHLAKFHGVIKTPKGPGLLFDLVTDDDGNVSKTLAHYLKKLPLKDFDVLLNELHDYLLNHTIYLSDLAADNIVVSVKNQKKKLVIVDGAVNSDMIKICDYSEYLRRKKIQRKWSRFVDSINIA